MSRHVYGNIFLSNFVLHILRDPVTYFSRLGICVDLGKKRMRGREDEKHEKHVTMRTRRETG